MKEIWKDIVGLEKFYQVSNLGKIKSKDRTILMKNGKTIVRKSRIMKDKKNNKGYHQIVLKDNNGNRYDKMIHRIVAEAFLENKDNLPTVNHKDGNKSNNCVENLEWMSYSDQNIHAIKTGLREIKKGFKLSEETKIKMSEKRKGKINPSTWKKVAQIDKDTDEIVHVFNSVREASEIFNCHYTTIADVATGKNGRKTAKGFKWKYLD